MQKLVFVLLSLILPLTVSGSQNDIWDEFKRFPSCIDRTGSGNSSAICLGAKRDNKMRNGGWSYFGTLSSGKSHGVGILILPNEFVYVGKFQNDRQDDVGVLYTDRGDIYLIGQWELGIFKQRLSDKRISDFFPFPSKSEISLIDDQIISLEEYEQALRLAERERADAKRFAKEKREKLSNALQAKNLTKLSWKERLNFVVQEELRTWISPPNHITAEIPPPQYPLSLSLKQEAWETNDEFDTRVKNARKERKKIIERIEGDYRQKVKERNTKVSEYNNTLKERQTKLPQKRRELIALGIEVLNPTVSIANVAFDQKTGSLTLTAAVEGLPKQTFAINGAAQGLRKSAITQPRSLKSQPEFSVSDDGEISLKGIEVEADGETAMGTPASGVVSSVQLASVRLPEVTAPKLEQQSIVTVDRNQVEQILYRDENEMLRKRLEEQRQQQEQAIANAEARANAEIARIKKGADIQKSQTPQVTPNLDYAAINSAHALVIGNSAYPGSAKLANPRNDAAAISAKLRSLGFKVTEVIDASRAQMVRSLSKFSETSEKADVTLLFYAGHGVQISGVNYMIPVDTNLGDISEASLQAISLNSVVERYLPGKTKLVFLDACRDNPLMTASSRGVTRGLAPINVSEGTLISYATKDGQTAADGTGQKNSPYTAALLEHLGDPQDIGIVLRKVRAKVMQRTGNRQQPWEYGSLTGGALVLTTIKK